MGSVVKSGQLPPTKPALVFHIASDLTGALAPHPHLTAEDLNDKMIELVGMGVPFHEYAAAHLTGPLGFYNRAEVGGIGVGDRLNGPKKSHFDTYAGNDHFATLVLNYAQSIWQGATPKVLVELGGGTGAFIYPFQVNFSLW